MTDINNPHSNPFDWPDHLWMDDFGGHSGDFDPAIGGTQYIRADIHEYKMSELNDINSELFDQCLRYIKEIEKLRQEK